MVSCSVYTKQLTIDQLVEAFTNAIPVIQRQLCEDHAKLQVQVDVDAAALNDKFSAAKDSFTYTYGGMDLYHGGLESLVGLPNPDIETAMVWEHTESWYATADFQCWYIPDGTTAKTEYECVAAGRVTAEQCKNGLRHAGHDGWTMEDVMMKHGKNTVMILGTGTKYDGLTGLL